MTSQIAYDYCGEPDRLLKLSFYLLFPDYSGSTWQNKVCWIFICYISAYVFMCKPSLFKKFL